MRYLIFQVYYTTHLHVMNNVEEVNIEGDGTFKYILIKLTSKTEGKTLSKVIVRGYNWAEFHGMHKI